MAIFVTAVTFAIGCERSSTGTYSETTLNEHLRPGTTRIDVERAFGHPSLLRATKTDKRMAIYEKPSREMPSSYTGKLRGFVVYYTNDVLEHWSPTYSDQTMVSTTTQTTPAESSGPNRPLLDAASSPDRISFYVTSSQEGNAVQSKRILSRTPDLEIADLESLSKVLYTTGAGESNQQIGLRIVLSKSDSEYFRKLTTENLGSRLVIVVGGEIVASSYLIAPIDNGSFSFRCGTQRERDILFARLQKFNRPRRDQAEENSTESGKDQIDPSK